MKKAFAALAVCALMAGMLATVPGCGPNNEELIAQSVTNTYDSYKQADDAALSTVVSSVENEAIAELGIDETAYASAVLDGFDYNIDAIDVDGDSAVVTITFAGKSYSELLSKISETTEELANDPQFEQMSQEDRRAAAGKRLMDEFNDLEVKNETVDLNYELVDGTWQPSDEQAGLDQIDNILFAK